MTTQTWLKGLLAAFISSAASALTVAVVDPQHFNLSAWKPLATVVVVSGVVGAAAYLKQSPIPQD